MTVLEVLSPCKLNLFLYITGRRADGYHDLQTLFTILNYGDILRFSPNETGQIRLLTDFGFPAEDNLIYRAARALKDYTHSAGGCDLACVKLLPQGGGLGGGSGNAATVLLVLNRLWNTGLGERELLELGKSLGADVPVFIKGVSAFAEGVGEVLTPVDLPIRHYLVASPGISVPTSLMFTHPALKKDCPKRTLDELMVAPFENCFTGPAAASFREIAVLLDTLSRFGQPFMSGSGSSCFVAFDTREEAARALDFLKARNIPAFTAPNVARSPVLELLDRL